MRRVSPEPPEIRAAGKSYVISGYAALFGSIYDMAGWFTEEVHRDAFKNADLSDVRVLFNHDSNHIHGRTKAGTARVWVDSKGLAYTCSLPPTSLGEALAESIRRGDVTESSWGFALNVTASGNGDTWTKRNGKDHRVLIDVKTIFDVSPVVYPANPATSVDLTGEAKRSLEAYHATHTGQRHTGQPGPSLSADMDTELMLLRLQMEHTQFGLSDAVASATRRRIADDATAADIRRLLAEMNAFANQSPKR